jgi:hypothetical protein
MSNKINEPASLAACLADRARDVASRADALAAEIAALHHDIRSAERETARQAGFRCDTATGSVRQAAGELRDTAADWTVSRPPAHRAHARSRGACAQCTATLWSAAAVRRGAGT